MFFTAALAGLCNGRGSIRCRGGAAEKNGTDLYETIEALGWCLEQLQTVCVSLTTPHGHLFGEDQVDARRLFVGEMR